MKRRAEEDEGPAAGAVEGAAGPARAGRVPAPPPGAGAGLPTQPPHQLETAPCAISDSSTGHRPITPAAAVPGHAAFSHAFSPTAAAGVAVDTPPRTASCAAAAGGQHGALTAKQELSITSFMRCVAGSALVQSALFALELSGGHPPPLLAAAEAASATSAASEQQRRGVPSSGSVLGGSPQLELPALASLECTLAQLLALHLRAGYQQGERRVLSGAG